MAIATIKYDEHNHPKRAKYHLVILGNLDYHTWLKEDTDAPVQVTQPLGYVGALPAIRINESTAEWTARDCYVSLLAASPPFSSIKLLRNCPIYF
jgi:hypothetical protein